MKNITRILAIAPYEGLKTMITNVAKQFEQIEVDVIVANLGEAEPFIKTVETAKYDVIVSRGGTAAFISGTAQVPVVNINISILDMLRVMHTARQSGNPFVVVGFGEVTRPASLVAEILKYETTIIEIRSKEEAESVMQELSQTSHKLVVGDVVTVNAARTYGLSSVLITSGKESVTSALTEAVNLSHNLNSLRQKVETYESMLDHITSAIALLNSDLKLLASNKSFQKMGIPTEMLVSTLSDETTPVICSYEDQLYSVTKETIEDRYFRGILVFVDRFTASNETKLLSSEITEAVDMPYCLYDSDVHRTLEALLHVDKSNRIYFIHGEHGTERKKLAQFIHTHTQRNNGNKGIFLTIQCEAFNDELFSTYEDTLKDILDKSNATLFIPDLHLMEISAVKQLAAFLEIAKLAGNECWIALSSTVSLTELIAQKNYPEIIFNSILASSIYIPPLRIRSSTIPTMCSIAVGKFNARLGKQVIGFDHDAIDFLTSQTWPLNEAQFESVISHVITITNNAYIKKCELMPFFNFPTKDTGEEIVLNSTMTLEQMNSEIIEHVLKNHSMNQTKAAESLGISRSTLWRKRSYDPKKIDAPVVKQV